MPVKTNTNFAEAASFVAATCNEYHHYTLNKTDADTSCLVYDKSKFSSEGKTNLFYMRHDDGGKITHVGIDNNANTYDIICYSCSKNIDPVFGELVKHAAWDLEKVQELQLKATNVVYQDLNITEKATIATVSMFEWASAKRPHDNIGFIGSFGAGPCVIVAIVSKDSENTPIVSMGHFDTLCNVEKSLDNMSRNHHDIENVYMVGGYSDTKLATNIKDYFENRQIDVKQDIRNGNSELIISLVDGQPINPTFKSKMLWIADENINKKMDIGIITSQIAAFSKAKQPLQRAFDLTQQRLPENYKPLKNLFNTSTDISGLGFLENFTKDNVDLKSNRFINRNFKL